VTAAEQEVGGAPAAGPDVHRTMGARRRLVPYYLLSPGGLFLTIFFLLPLCLMLYTSLQSGGLLSGGFTFTWQFSNYGDVLGQYQVQFVRSLVYAGIVTIVALLLAYEHSLVRPGDLRRLDAAFFTVNGVISLIFFACVALDVLV